MACKQMEQQAKVYGRNRKERMQGWATILRHSGRTMSEACCDRLRWQQAILKGGGEKRGLTDVLSTVTSS